MTEMDRKAGKGYGGCWKERRRKLWEEKGYWGKWGDPLQVLAGSLPHKWAPHNRAILFLGRNCWLVQGVKTEGAHKGRLVVEKERRKQEKWTGCGGFQKKERGNSWGWGWGNEMLLTSPRKVSQVWGDWCCKQARQIFLQTWTISQALSKACWIRHSNEQ